MLISPYGLSNPQTLWDEYMAEDILQRLPAMWDESTMSHKKVIEALNCTLQDLRDSTDIMGRMVVLLAGDFRQTLPVIQRGTLVDEIRACIKSSSLWAKVEKFS
ncbi:ATP-dependent DNA helicase [Trichonephila clavipes]|nr:ATP-dependent DNA helicase [Trichonephila clavipes]